ncbi:MAG: hypothetical protein AAB407_04070 [Patescibacteria group bacterium]
MKHSIVLTSVVVSLFAVVMWGMPVQAQAAQISGFITDPDGVAVRSLDTHFIRVFAYQRGGNWKEGMYNPKTGSYSIDGLTLGKWYVTANIHSETTGFLGAPIADPVTLATNATVQNIKLRRISGVLSGSVLDDSGFPIANALVNITNKISGEIFSGETNAQGLYHLIATKGLYSLGAFFGANKDMVAPEEVDGVKISDGALAKISFVFSKPEANVIGKVSSGNFSIPVAGAIVYAWSDQGRSAEAVATTDGSYRLQFISNTKDVWHVHALQQIGNTVYYSDEITFPSSSNIVNQTITLAHSRVLPPVVTKTFSSTEPATIQLSDGMSFSIPSHAVASDSFTVSVVPSAARLQKDVAVQSNRYDVLVYDASGKKISTLNQSAVVEIPYTASLANTVEDNAFHLFFWNPFVRAWQSNGNSVTDTEHKSVVGLVNYLAGFIVVTPQVDRVAGSGGAPPTLPPTAASNFAVIAQGATSALLSWVDPILEVGERRTIERSGNPNSGFVTIADTTNNTLSISQTSYTDTGLQAQTQYCYRSRSFTENGTAISLVQCVTTQPAPPDATPPVISNLVAQVTDTVAGVASIVWTTNEPASSNISCSIGGQSSVNSAQPNFIVLHSFPFIAQLGTQYVCAVSSTDASGNSAVSSVVLIVPAVTQTPSQLQASSAIPQTSAATLPASLIGSGQLLRNLNVGATGPDVQLFQRVLNALPCCKIANFGPGSPDNETPFYGPLTAGAVRRFQQTYIPEILAAQGIPEGTSNLGTFTRGIFNELLQGGSILP